jgi:hypothetical protein
LREDATAEALRGRAAADPHDGRLQVLAALVDLGDLVGVGFALLAEVNPNRRRDLLQQTLTTAHTSGQLHALARLARSTANHPTTTTDAAILHTLARAIDHPTRTVGLPDQHRTRLSGPTRYTWISHLGHATKTQPHLAGAYHTTARAIATCGR